MPQNITVYFKNTLAPVMGPNGEVKIKLECRNYVDDIPCYCMSESKFDVSSNGTVMKKIEINWDHVDIVTITYTQGYNVYIFVFGFKVWEALLSLTSDAYQPQLHKESAHYQYVITLSKDVSRPYIRLNGQRTNDYFTDYNTCSCIADSFTLFAHTTVDYVGHLCINTQETFISGLSCFVGAETSDRYHNKGEVTATLAGEKSTSEEM